MAEAPGSFGNLLTGHVVDFKANPAAFGTRKREKYGPVSKVKLMDKGIYVCGAPEVARVLEADLRALSTSRATQKFIGELCGRGIVLADGDEARQARAVLAEVMREANVAPLVGALRASAAMLWEERARSAAGTREAAEKTDDDVAVIDVYEEVKSWATRETLLLFLGRELDADGERLGAIVRTSAAIFRGVVGLPMSLPGGAFAKAKAAGDELRALLRGLVHEEQTRQADGEAGTDAAERGSLFPLLVSRYAPVEQGAAAAATCPDLLLDVLVHAASPLIPKLIASAMTSFVLEIAAQAPLVREMRGADGEGAHARAWNEVLRLWPPLIMTTRRAVTPITVRRGMADEDDGGDDGDDVLVPDGAMIFLDLHTASRDPRRSDDADAFHPDAAAAAKCPHLAFGSGPRACPAQPIVMPMLTALSTSLLAAWNYRLTVRRAESAGEQPSATVGERLRRKWLPVSRPVDNVMLHLKRRKR